MAVYLSAVYASEDDARRFKEAYIDTGKRLDMGKSCVRFRSLDDLPLDLIGDAVAAVGVDDFIAMSRR
jgi:hypothetical protein